MRPDVEKLGSIANENFYILVLWTSNPGRQDWWNGIDRFNMTSPRLHIRSLMDTSGFPEFCSLGVLKIVPADKGLAV